MAKQSEATLLLKIVSTGGEVLEKTGDALATVGKLGAAAFTLISTGVAASIVAYRGQEEATNSLNQALLNQGIYSKELSASYQKMASELQNVTTYGDEAIVAAQAQMQAHLGQTHITKQLTMAVLDFATAQKMDLKSAAEVVGKSIGTSTNMLGRYGIEVSTTATNSEKLTQVMQGLNSKFGGQAQAAAQGLGSLEQMKNAMGDILEVVGQKLEPVISAAARYITKFAVELQNNNHLIDGFVASVNFMAKSGIVIKNVFEGIAGAISGVLGTAVGAVVQMLDGNFKMAYESMKTGFSGVTQDISTQYTSMKQEIAAVDDVFNQQKIVSDEEEILRIETNAQRKKDIEIAHQNDLKAIFAARDQEEIMRIQFQNAFKNNLALQEINAKIAQAKDETTRLELEYQKRKMLDEAFVEFKKAKRKELNVFEQTLGMENAKNFEGGLNSMVQMQNSKSKELAAIGKAAAIVQIVAQTAQGAMQAFNAFAFIPFIGPALGFAAAGAVIAYGAERVATVSGLQLAEGGIVKSTPGGIPATIGEGKYDEAVIPLKDGNSGLGNSISITVNGGLLGDQAQAKEFALALDRELFKLRKSNESIAFDSGVI